MSVAPGTFIAMAGETVPAGVRFVWEQAEKRLEAQLRQADSLDAKAGALVGLHALAAGLVATAATRLSHGARWIAVGVICALVTSGFLAFAAYRVENYDRNPSPEDLWRFGSWQEEQIEHRLLQARFVALRSNAYRLRRKARLVSWSLAGLAVVALAVAATSVIAFVRSA
jgi:hypothetical protein